MPCQGPTAHHRAPRSPHPPLRHRRNRQRKLALQEPRLTLPPFLPASLELFAKEVMPEFRERHHLQQQWRSQKLDGVSCL
jgi:hypothetical protein